MATEKQAAPVQEGRTRRKALDSRAKLSVPNQDPNFVYRIVNVDGDRVEEFIERGYEIVSDAEAGGKRIDNGTPLGAQFSVGNGIKAVVMRQRKDWYQEDQKIKQDHILELEKTMTSEAKKGL